MLAPQDIALAIIGEVFANGFVKNKVMEFVGPGVSNLSVDYRIGVDVMTTETTCLSSIWRTDDQVKEFYEIHGRTGDFEELNPGETAYYDSFIELDLSEIKPMIAMPFHPSNTYTIEELNANLMDILDDCEKRAQVSFDGKVDLDLKSKVKNGRLYVDQGIIAGCAGGGFENICDAADILKGSSIGADEFTLSVYPASTPIYMELVKNGAVANLLETGAIVKTAFCGPCFGAGDTPANNAFSIRHSTRNFPNREGSKVQNGQVASVALMDARSIAATAANKGFLTAATDIDVNYSKPKYFFDKTIYENRVFDSKGVADPDVEIQFGTKYQGLAGYEPTSGESCAESCFRDSRSGDHNGRADSFRRDILFPFQPTGTGRVCTFQKGSGICWTCQGSTEGTEGCRGRYLSGGCTSGDSSGYGYHPCNVLRCQPLKRWFWKYDFCSKTGRRFCA